MITHRDALVPWVLALFVVALMLFGLVALDHFVGWPFRSNRWVAIAIIVAGPFSLAYFARRYSQWAFAFTVLVLLIGSPWIVLHGRLSLVFGPRDWRDQTYEQLEKRRIRVSDFRGASSIDYASDSSIDSHDELVHGHMTRDVFDAALRNKQLPSMTQGAYWHQGLWAKPGYTPPWWTPPKLRPDIWSTVIVYPGMRASGRYLIYDPVNEELWMHDCSHQWWDAADVTRPTAP
jgi:hypothetical protein